MTNINYALTALGAIATARDSNASHGPNLAFDGNDGTYYQDNSGLHTTPWLKIDLGAPTHITTVRYLQNVLAAAAGRVGVYGSLDDVTYDQLDYQYPATTDQTRNLGNVTYRYFKLTGYIPGGGDWHVYSFEVLGPIDAPPNPTLPMCDEISDWLDAIEAYFVPCVDTWLSNN